MPRTAPLLAGALALAVVLAGCAAPPVAHPPSPPPPGSPAPPPIPPPATPPPSGNVRLTIFIEGLDRPVWLADAGELGVFVVEQGGRVRLWRDGELREALDLRGQVSTGGEQGLLSLALDPAFASNRRAYVDYTDRDGHTIVARYAVGEDGVFDAGSARQLLRVEQPYSNHNGGLLLFGPDGLLYVGLGDGGSGGDPRGNGQRLDTLLGKLLRLDVRGEGYAVPDDNPFLPGARPEIWAYGLRNPWRFSFDRATGDLWIADVGQNAWEEVNLQPADSPGGQNYGWNRFEGTHPYRGSGDASGMVMPVHEYPTGEGCSVTGGYVYRGPALPGLQGRYVFGDYCSGNVWTLRHDGQRWVRDDLLDSGARISSFAEDAAGELYLLDHQGRVLRFVPG